MSEVQGPPAWHPAPDDVKDAARRAAAAAGEHGVDIAKLAIMEAVQQRGVATTLIGFATPEQARLNSWTFVVASSAEIRPNTTRSRLLPAVNSR